MGSLKPRGQIPKEFGGYVKKYWTGISNDELRKTIRENCHKKSPL